MKTSDYFGSSRSRYASAAILAFALTLGLAPRAVRATCTPAVPCVGDCDGKGSVTVDEVLKMVNIALGNAAVATCTAGDGNCDNAITVDEILTAVNSALSGCAPPPAACGNGVVNSGEDCDVGGFCIGGSNAGTACTTEGQCHGDGVCIGGTKIEVACADDTACAGGGKCVHCVTFGNSTIPGDATHTCAANCTFERTFNATLFTGKCCDSAAATNCQSPTKECTPDTVTVDCTTAPFKVCAGGSGAGVYSEYIGLLSLTLSGTETFLVGKKGTNGEIPVVVPASSVKFDAINVGSIACACVRGIPVKTCGGTLFEADGVTATLNCTEGYTAGGSVCSDAGKPPCAFVNGPGNTAAGVIAGCGSTLPGVNLLFTEDSQGIADPPLQEAARCDATLTDPPIFNPPNPPYPMCGHPPVIALSGTGPGGSAILINTTAIGEFISGNCSQASPDFCTDNAPFSDRGQPQSLPAVSGSAAGYITNANQTNSDTICNCVGGPAQGVACAPADCVGGSPDAGPISISGSTIDCTKAESGDLSGLGLAGTFTQISSATTGDIVVTNLQKLK